MKQNAFAALEAGPVLRGDIVLALLLGEGDQRDVVLARRTLRWPAMKALLMGSMRAEEAKVWPRWKRKNEATPRVGLQSRLVDVEVHAVDAFDFQGHVLADDFGNGAWYTHGWLRSTRTLGDHYRFERSNWGCFSIPRHRLDRSLFLYILSV